MTTKHFDLNLKLFLDSCEITLLKVHFEHFRTSIPKHCHGKNSIEIHYIPYGKGKLMLNGKRYIITPHTLYITGPFVEHEQTPDPTDPMAEYSIYIKITEPSADIQCGMSYTNVFKTNPMWFGTNMQDFHPIFQELFYELEQTNTGYKDMIRYLITKCLVKIIRQMQHGNDEKKHAHSSPAVDQKYIIAEDCFLYEYEDLTLPRLSARLYLSTRQTERFLKECYGKTFLQKRTEAKMSAAAMMLRDTSYSITEISIRLGYASIEHFSQAFKKYYGISARQYRKTHSRPL